MGGDVTSEVRLQAVQIKDSERKTSELPGQIRVKPRGIAGGSYVRSKGTSTWNLEGESEGRMWRSNSGRWSCKPRKNVKGSLF